jgi:hypothetical protein
MKHATLAVIIGLTFAPGAFGGPFEDADAFYEHGDYTAALARFRSLADQGDPRGQFSLGAMYSLGFGVAQDDSEAALWYRKAADQGHAFAQYSLGEMYFEGRGVAKDYAQSLLWYHKSADQGFAPAQGALAFMYEQGIGVPQDKDEAAKWRKKAAEAAAAASGRESAAQPSGFVVEGSATIFPPTGPTVANDGNLPRISSASVTRDGALLLAGRTDDSHSLYAKVTPAGQIAWQKTPGQAWPVYGGSYLFEGSTGGYWGLGIAHSRDIRDEVKRATKPLEWSNLTSQVSYQYLLQMDSSGSAIAQRQLFHFSEHNITCGLDVGDGLVFTGWQQMRVEAPDAPGGSRMRIIPWIQKATINGKVVWEHPIATLDDAPILLVVDRETNCKGLRRLPSGTIVWAVTVEDAMALEEVRTDPRSLSEQASGSHLATLLVSIDSHGTERHWAADRRADRVLLLPLPDGEMALVEHLRPEIPESIFKMPVVLAAPAMKAGESTGGVRVSWLDGDLRTSRFREFRIPQLNLLGDVTPISDSEFLAAGCDSGVQFIARLNADTGIHQVGKVHQSRNLLECASFAWTRNPANGDYVLFAVNQQDGAEIVSVRLTP